MLPKNLDIRIFNPELSAFQEFWCSVYLVLYKSCKLLKRSVDMFGEGIELLTIELVVLQSFNISCNVFGIFVCLT